MDQFRSITLLQGKLIRVVPKYTMRRKEIKTKTITQSNDATSIGCRHGKIKRAKRNSSKRMRQLLKQEDKCLL